MNKTTQVILKILGAIVSALLGAGGTYAVMS